MVAILVDVELTHVSNLPEDSAHNTWCFIDGGESDPAVLAADVFPDLDTFYSTIGGMISNCVKRGSTDLKMQAYNLTGHLGPPATHLGSPVADFSFGIGGAGSPGNIPSECAVVLSFHGDLTGIPVEDGVTRPASRRTGRVYLGPLNITATMSDGTTGECRFDTTASTQLIFAANSLLTNQAGKWAVWSREGGYLTVVTGGWVDNAFDTQRRRGVEATARTLFP